MKEKLERRFLAKLENVNHISENQHYIGYSKLYNRKIFIKVFDDENKFILENEILKDESSLYITSDYLNKILVLSFREYKNLVSSDMENDVLIKISKVISNFHKKKYIDKGKYKETSLKKILEYNAKGVILVHNHPSGSLKPSESDILLTRKVKEVLENIEIRLLDHLIISERGHFSFLEGGIL